MILQEISRDKWESFCNEFSHLHKGWLVNVAQVDSHLLKQSGEEIEMNTAVPAEGIPLEAVDCHQEDRDMVFSIIAGDGDGRTVQQIREPGRVIFEKTDKGAHHGLRISNGRHQTTLVRFRADARPQDVNGYSKEEIQSVKGR